MTLSIYLGVPSHSSSSSSSSSSWHPSPSSANEEERERRAHIILFGQRTEQRQARGREKRLIARLFFFLGHPRILFPDFLNHFSRRENFALGGGREEWKGGKIGEIEFPLPVNWGAIAMYVRNFSFFLPTVVRKVPTALSCRDWYVETFYLPAAEKEI